MKKFQLVLSLTFCLWSFAGSAMENIGTYFEIPVNDIDRAIEFYSDVFECELVKETIHGNEMAFFPFDGQGAGITGGLAKGESYKPSMNGSLIYLSTKDADNILKRVLAAGGETLFPKTLVPGLGYSAEFKDSEGNRVALFEKLTP